MYLHRPDLLSLAFGLAFTALGVLALTGAGLTLPLVLGILAVTAGVGLAGSLLTGDVHRRAGARRAQRAAAVGGPPAWAPAWAPTPAPDSSAAAAGAPVGAGHPDPVEAELDALFGPPIDPEALDRAYRDRFGEDDPLRDAPAPPPGSAGGEGAAEGTAG